MKKAEVLSLTQRKAAEGRRAQEKLFNSQDNGQFTIQALDRCSILGKARRTTGQQVNVPLPSGARTCRLILGLPGLAVQAECQVPDS